MPARGGLESVPDLNPAAKVWKFEVFVDSTKDRYALLTDAEADLRSAVEAERRESAEPRQLVGILVTRHDARRCTIGIDETVPRGETWGKTLYRI